MIKTKWFSLFSKNVFTFGEQKVTQFIIFECKYLFSALFFYFHKTNGVQDRYHSHAFNAISLKFFGKYTEYFYFEAVDKYGSKDRTELLRFFPKNSMHKIGNSTGCLTLLLSGPWGKTWKELNDKGEVTTYKWGREHE